MKKRTISLLICIVMVLSLMPTVAFADDPASYDIQVNGEAVTSANAENVLGDGKVSYELATDKLSINNFDGDLNIIGNDTVDIEITGTTTMAVNGALSITGAHNVTVNSNASAPTISGGAIISCSGDILISSTNFFAVSGDLTVTSAAAVTVKNESATAIAAAITGSATINCTGDVTIESAGNTSAVNTGLTVAGAKNVTATSAANSNTPVISSGANIGCSGDVKIICKGAGYAVSGDLTVNGAKNVTVKNESPSAGNPAVAGSADITCTGDVTIQNPGNSYAARDGLKVTGANNVTVTANASGPVIGGNTTINCSGNVLIDSKGTGFAVQGKLIVTDAKDVTVRHSSATATDSTVTDGADITCTGNVTITNAGALLAVKNGLKVSGAKNVTVTANTSGPVIGGKDGVGYISGAEITCTGDVSIINQSTDAAGFAVGGSLTVDGAKNVIVTSNGTNPTVTVHATIKSSGNVLIQNSGSQWAVGGTLTYQRIAGAGDYYVKTGDSTGSLTTVATKADGESCTVNDSSKVIYICSQYVYIEPSFRVNLASDVENGALSLSAKNAYEGATVTVTAAPADGCTVKAVSVTTVSGKAITVTELGGGKFSFRMPNADVTVTAEFAPDAELCPVEKFTDTKPDAWYHDGVHFCVERGLMKGVSDTLFAPNGSTTRGQIVEMLYRLEGEPAFMNGNMFSDVAEGAWFEKAVVWAQGKGIVSGYGNGSFGPNDPISREQLAVILYHYAQFMGVDVSVDENTNFLNFNDFQSISDWAKPAMMWAVERGLLVGDNWELRPQGGATRAQTATVFQRFCEMLEK